MFGHFTTLCMKGLKFFIFFIIYFEYLTIRLPIGQVSGMDFPHVCHELLYLVTTKAKNRTIDVKESNFQQANRFHTLFRSFHC